MLVEKYNHFLLITFEKFMYHFSKNISETNTVRVEVGKETHRESLISAPYRRMNQAVIISSKG